MKITKLGHCCLVLEVNGVKVLTDPGSFTTAQDTLTGIDILLITHEHGDHYHVESVKKILVNNPNAHVVANASVTVLIQKEGIPAQGTVVGDGGSVEVKGIKIEGFGKEHAPIYGSMGQCENTGYMVAEKFYIPGDNFHAPNKKVDVLALPVAGPWMKLADAVDFAKKIAPRVAF